jgi:hypothetical protein
MKTAGIFSGAKIPSNGALKSVFHLRRHNPLAGARQICILVADGKVIWPRLGGGAGLHYGIQIIESFVHRR